MTGSELYDATSFDLARRLTMRYSSSFGLASRLFERTIRPHIYAIYGMVRIADEIVDTYTGPDKAEVLETFRTEVQTSLTSGYSTNPIIQAFAITAQTYDIGIDLIDPFFASMAADLTATTFTESEYSEYIYGSAEVIGLMCLKVFCGGDQEEYDDLAPGARTLGSAYQKVNFLRDFGADEQELGRVYFPGVTRTTWNDVQKDAIIMDITKEFDEAKEYIKRLPPSVKTSVHLSYLYYRRLLAQLSRMSAATVSSRRAHVSMLTKLSLLVLAPLEARFL